MRIYLASVLAAFLSGCASLHGATGWVTVVDGENGLENFNPVGAANWKVVDGAIQADPSGKAPGYLVSKSSYKDFKIRVEFWASDDANSGVFLRCQDPAKITDQSCYEANIYDQRPDPTYGTGAITGIVPVAAPMPKAGGKWNTYEITCRGEHLVLVLNGRKTVDARNSKFVSGPYALQWVQGTIKFRKVEIRRL